MATFEDLGIGQRLAAAAAGLGWEAPSGLQEDALPVIRRGNNVVLHASPGAGTTGAYGLGILDRVEGDSDLELNAPLVLILVTDTDAASRTAGSLARLAVSVGAGVRALAPGWPARPASLLVAPPVAARAALGDSSLKLDRLIALVIDGADQMAQLGEWPAVETVVASAPSTAQRVVVSGTVDAALEDFADRHARKAMTFPSRPESEPDAAVTAGPAARFMVAAEHEKAAAAAGLLSRLDADDVALICRTRDRAGALAADLRGRGVGFEGGTGAPRCVVLSAGDADERSTRAVVLSCDVPLDAAALKRLHASGGAVLVTPRELSHLRRIAARAGIRLEQERPPAPPPVGAAEAVRARLRALLSDGDLAADLALIEPLLVDHPAAEIAAAALQLARARTEAEPRAGAAAAGPAAPHGAPPPTANWVRLFISAGSRDGIGPGDLVGAITGESALEGSRVGKIEIREAYSTVEVPAESADGVIRALNGRSLRGRSLRVDYDRQDRAPRRPAAPRGERAGGGRPGGSKPGGGRTGGGRAGGGRPGGGRAGNRPQG